MIEQLYMIQYVKLDGSNENGVVAHDREVVLDDDFDYVQEYVTRLNKTNTEYNHFVVALIPVMESKSGGTSNSCNARKS